MRTPDEILTDIDAAQEALTNANYAVDLRALAWEVIEDLLDSLNGYAEWDWANGVLPEHVVDECKKMLTDYVVNNYGDN